MKWFKHISDSLDDPFIFDLVSLFGGDGYLVFFGVLEIYSREFKPELNWNLSITRGYLKQKLQKRQDTLIIKILKHIQKSGKWEIEFRESQVIIFIPKFTEFIDEWTQRKLGSSSGVSRKKLRTEEEAEEEAEADKRKERSCPESKNDSAPEQVEPADVAQSVPVVLIPLTPKDGERAIYQPQIDSWQIDFPGIDVVQELRKLRQWNLANPTRRKTKSGIMRHIASWLSKAQDSAGMRQPARTKPATTYRQEQMAQTGALLDAIEIDRFDTERRAIGASQAIRALSGSGA